MIVKSLEDIVGTKDDVADGNWRSRRFVSAHDRLGFSVNDTVIKGGTKNYFWYKNHIEAVYVIEGEGEIEQIETGKVWQLKPGTIYVLNENDKHEVRTKTDMRMVCVFNPPLVGTETHDEDGIYPVLTLEEVQE
ncbi:ectoine synthase [Oceanobacillus alkalisoli]|uniref:ectoine synthase n=1 Tax=Oceanobacillus alkalisoli TaxID=2925113 RepID=UPI001EF04EF5|nr:ectoine synthase [Oceanobacillus alkalisoli]MCF3942881.1 ectoine synthase [Oceanobacillus alkalisoli]MCG5102394.1 ectoine synthase [Oceanobacillus alkalisoli]